MSSAGMSWTSLNPSRERRAWLAFASAVSAGLALVLFGQATVGMSAGLAVGALVCGAAAAAAARSARQGEAAWTIAIDAEGGIWARRGGDAPAVRVRPRVIGDRLVTLALARETIVVWRDALSADRFRRLCAYARWQVERADPYPNDAALAAPSRH